MRGRLDVRELDDPGDLALDAQQMMAGSSGNPLLVERTEVDVTVQKLSRRARGHDKAQAALKFRRSSAEQRLGQIERILPAVEEALTRRIDTQGDRFRARVAGVEYDNRGEASEAIYSHIKGFTRPGGGLINGGGNRIEIGGFFVNVDFRHDYATGRRVLLTLEGTGALPESVQVEIDFDAILDPQSSAPRNVAQLLENKVTGLDKVRDRLVANRAEAEQTLEAVGEQLGKPFKHADELAAAKAKLADIDAKIKEMQEAEDRKKREPGPEAAGDGTEAGYSVTTVAVTPTRSGVRVSEPETSDYAETGQRLSSVPKTAANEAESEAAAHAQSERMGRSQRLGDEAKKITTQVEERTAAAVERVRREATDKHKLSPALSVYRYELERVATMCSTGLEAFSAAVETAESSAHEDELKVHEARLIDAHGKIKQLQENLKSVEAHAARSPGEPVSSELYAPPAQQPASAVPSVE
ncbi:hypothetical protein [Brevibacterium casei]